MRITQLVIVHTLPSPSIECLLYDLHIYFLPYLLFFIQEITCRPRIKLQLNNHRECYRRGTD